MSYLTSFIAIASASLCTGIIFYSYSRTRDWLHPLQLISAFFLVFYLGKYLYASYTGTLIFSYNYREEIDQSSLDAAAIYSFLSLGFFAIGFLVPSGKFPNFYIHRRSRPIGAPIIIFSGLISAASMCAVFWNVDSSSIGSAIGNRFELFAERGYLLVLSSALKVSFLLWLASSKTRPKSWTIVTLWIGTLTVDLLTGSRGRVLFENVLPLIYILHHKRYLQIRLTRALVVVAIGIIFSITYRAATRDSLMESNRNMDFAALTSNALQETFADFYEGPEAPFFDTTAMLLDSKHELMWGSSIAALITYPIPRSLFEEKPRGASSVLTEEYFPDYYHPNRVEIGFPLQSELIANFGIPGIFGMLFFGGLSGYAYRSIKGSHPLFMVAYIFFTIRSVLLFRNDLFNNGTALLAFALFSYTIYRLNSLRIR